MNSESVTALVVAQLQGHGEPMPVRVELRWDATDPYAVWVVFQTGRTDAGDVPWVLSRELLAEGLHAPAGIGDVHIRPDEAELFITVLELSSPSGYALFELDTVDLSEFLELTYDHVPLGAEELFIDLDFEIAMLWEGENR
jgi:hypothetical protein